MSSAVPIATASVIPALTEGSRPVVQIVAPGAVAIELNDMLQLFAAYDREIDKGAELLMELRRCTAVADELDSSAHSRVMRHLLDAARMMGWNLMEAARAALDHPLDIRVGFADAFEEAAADGEELAQHRLSTALTGAGAMLAITGPDPHSIRVRFETLQAFILMLDLSVDLEPSLDGQVREWVSSLKGELDKADCYGVDALVLEPADRVDRLAEVCQVASFDEAERFVVVFSTVAAVAARALRQAGARAALAILDESRD
jgi:hypothetical protein